MLYYATKLTPCAYLAFTTNPPHVLPYCLYMISYPTCLGFDISNLLPTITLYIHCLVHHNEITLIWWRSKSHHMPIISLQTFIHVKSQICVPIFMAWYCALLMWQELVARRWVRNIDCQEQYMEHEEELTKHS